MDYYKKYIKYKTKYLDLKYQEDESKCGSDRKFILALVARLPIKPYTANGMFTIWIGLTIGTSVLRTMTDKKNGKDQHLFYWMANILKFWINWNGIRILYMHIKNGCILMII